MFDRLFEIARIYNFSTEELLEYEANRMNMLDYNASMTFARKEGVAIGEAKGITLGKEEGVLQTARKMKAKGLNIAVMIEKQMAALEHIFNSSHNTGDSVYESMKKSRDIVRRQGRKVMGKYIGTTLLTKGLEFDTVIVLEAHKFTDPKNFYVALTRACKKLIVFTNNAILTPYNNSYF